MDECGYCKGMIPQGVDHYCQEELLEEIENVRKLLHKFYVKFESGMPMAERKQALTVSSTSHSLLLIKSVIENDKEWNERTKEHRENRYGLWK
jgi:hypothetical protein